MTGMTLVLSLLLFSTIGIIQLSKGYVLTPFGIKMCVELCFSLHCPPDYDIYSLSCKVRELHGMARTTGKIKAEQRHNKHYRLLLSRTKGEIQVELKNNDLKKFQGCGEPPAVTGSYRSYDSHFLSAIVNHTCSEDFRNCLNTSTSVCQSTGQWQDVTGLCGQNRWHNPNVGELHYLPCGPTDRFSVSVVGIPTKARRVSLDINGRGDLLFHVDFRINFIHSKEIIINNRIADIWGSQIRIARMPLVEGQEFHLVVTLDNGHYKMMVDDVSLYNFTERLPGASPEYIQLHCDVSVSLWSSQCDLSSSL